MSNLIYLVQWQGRNCLCVCHNDHQLFGIGYHFKIFRSQVATGKKVNFTPCFDNVMLKFIANNRTGVWKTQSNLLNLHSWQLACTLAQLKSDNILKLLAWLENLLVIGNLTAQFWALGIHSQGLLGDCLNLYGLLTKCEVKMAGYWPSSFSSRSINTERKNEANIQPSWPNKLGQ